jgi:hypothetical protein
MLYNHWFDCKALICFKLKINYTMEKKIIEIAKKLIEVRQLREELYDKEYWINKAAKETDFIPAEGDGIRVSVSLYTIEVAVHHKEYGGTRYWKNGVWLKHITSSDYPMHEKMLEKMQAE